MTTQNNALPTEWHRKPKGFRYHPCPICGYPKRDGEHRAVTPEENMAAKWLCRRKSRTGWQMFPVFESGRKEPTRGEHPKPLKPSRIKSKLIEMKSIANDRADQLRFVTRELRKNESKIRRLEHKASKAKSPSKGPPQKPGPAPSHHPIGRVAELMGKAASLVACGNSYREAAETLGVAHATIYQWRRRWKEHWQTLFDSASESLLKSVRAMAGTKTMADDPDAYMKMAQCADRWAHQQQVELFPVNEGEMTLSQFYNDWYLPNRLGDAREKTKEAYRTAIKQWRLLMGDPPIKDITTTTISSFRDALMKMRGRKKHLPMSPNSVRSYMRHIQVLLDKLGPPGKGNRDALDILARVPWAKPPREVERIPQIVSLRQISDCIMASVAMEFPRFSGVKAPAWWRALLIVAWNTGLRIGTLLSMRMDEVDWAKSRLVLPAARMKSRRPMIVHLNPPAMTALRSIRTDRELVFPWQETGRRNFYKYLHKLEKAAGIPRSEHFGMHAIRKTVATMLYEVNPGAAQFALGHTTNDVTRKSYVDGGGLVARALDQLPQPEGFPTDGQSLNDNAA